MANKSLAWIVCLGMVVCAVQAPVAGEEFSDAIKALLQDHIDIEKKNVGMVVGIIDEHGSRVICYGKTGNVQSPDVGADTIFEIGSISKTFTTLLLQQMVDRGQMKLDDPVARYLPASVKMPARNGKQITLLHLATHSSGLPDDPDNYSPRDWTNPYADYTDEKLYSFLSRYTLTRDPEGQKEYSNLGVGLLGHVIALKAGTDFESLVVDRICNPLHMDSTRITLSPELKTRSAIGHSWFGDTQNDLVFGEALMGNGAIHSNVNDMLKFVSANLDLDHSPLSLIMQKTHVVRLADMGLGWGVSGDWVSHGGMTLGCTATVTLDKKQRGVVGLSNQAFDPEAQKLDAILLKSEWRSDKRPTAVNLDERTLDSYVGQYQAGTERPIGIYREGRRLLVKVHEFPVQEIMPESKTDFFMRVSAQRVTFRLDAQGKVTEVSGDLNLSGTESTLKKTLDRSPALRAPREHPVVIKEGLERYEACFGTFTLPSGRIVIVSREGDHLLAAYKGWLGFKIYPVSENQLCCTYVPLVATVNRDENGKAAGLTITSEIFPKELTGKATKTMPSGK